MEVAEATLADTGNLYFMSNTAWIYTGIVFAAWTLPILAFPLQSAYILGALFVLSAIQTGCLDWKAPQLGPWLLRSAVVAAPFITCYWIAPLWRLPREHFLAVHSANKNDPRYYLGAALVVLLSCLIFASVAFGLRLILREHRVVRFARVFRLATEVPLFLSVAIGCESIRSLTMLTFPG